MLFLNEIRLVEGYGNYNEKRWEVQRKYRYLDCKGEIVYAWSLVFHSNDKEASEKVLEKYKNTPLKDYKIDFEDTIKYFS